MVVRFSRAGRASRPQRTRDPGRRQHRHRSEASIALPSLSWGWYITIVLVYWILVVGAGWTFYATRRSTRRALERALMAEEKDPGTGRIVRVSSQVNLLPIGALLFGPSLALLIVWLAASQAMRYGEPLPNKRLKLAASGLGRNCVRAPAGSCGSQLSWHRRGWAPQRKLDPSGRDRRV